MTSLNCVGRKIKARLTEKGLHAVYLGTFPHVYSMLRSSSDQKQFKLNDFIYRYELVEIHGA